MGYYINHNSKGDYLNAKNKLDQLLNDGAVPTGNSFKENLICVVENGHFDAVGYVYDEKEYEHFNYAEDKRVKHWLVYEHAKRLSGYKEAHQVQIES